MGILVQTCIVAVVVAVDQDAVVAVAGLNADVADPDAVVVVGLDVAGTDPAKLACPMEQASSRLGIVHIVVAVAGWHSPE